MSNSSNEPIPGELDKRNQFEVAQLAAALDSYALGICRRATASSHSEIATHFVKLAEELRKCPTMPAVLEFLFTSGLSRK